MKRLLLAVLLFPVFAEAQILRLNLIADAAISAHGVDTVMSGSISNLSSMDINLSSVAANYRSFIIYFNNIVPQTSSTSLNVLVSADGTTYDNGTGNYTWFWSDINATNPSASSAALAQLESHIPNGTGQSVSGYLMVFGPNTSNKQPNYFGQLNDQTAAINFAFTRFNAQTTKGIRFFCGSGNITGSYVVVGIK